MKSSLEIFVVKKEEVNNRIDSYLANKKEEISRVAVQRLIEEEKMIKRQKPLIKYRKMIK